MQQEISVTIYGLESTLYDGKVQAITSKNVKGTFDILPTHSNFISLVEDLLILHERAGTKKEFKMKNGVLEVVNNHVSVFLDVEGLKEA